jgi:hypothetical protein
MTEATIIFFCAFCANAIYTWHRIGSRFSLCLLLFGAVLVVHGIPLLIYLYLTGPDTFIFEEALRFVDPEVTKSRFLIAMSLMFASLVFGAEIANAVFPRWYRYAKRRKPSDGTHSSQQVVMISALQQVILWVVVLAMLGVSMHESHLSSVITFFQFTGSEFEKTLLRIELGGSPYYWYNVMLCSVVPFLVMVSYCNDVGARNRRWPSALTVALFCVVLLGKFGTLSKAPPVIFMLQLLLLRVLLNNPILNFKVAIKLVFWALLLFMFITRFTLPELDIAGGLSFLYYRTFDIPNEVLLECFSAIPSVIPHSWGQSVLGFLNGSIPKENIEMYSAVAEVTRNSLESTSNAMFVGDAWAQFSWYGVVFVSIAAGFFVRLIDLYSLRNGYTDQYACLIAGGSFGIFTILSTAFTTGFITGGLVLIPLFSTFFVRRRIVPIIPLSKAIVPTQTLQP